MLQITPFNGWNNMQIPIPAIPLSQNFSQFYSNQYNQILLPTISSSQLNQFTFFGSNCNNLQQSQLLQQQQQQLSFQEKEQKQEQQQLQKQEQEQNSYLYALTSSFLEPQQSHSTSQKFSQTTSHNLPSCNMKSENTYSISSHNLSTIVIKSENELPIPSKLLPSLSVKSKIKKQSYLSSKSKICKYSFIKERKQKNVSSIKLSNNFLQPYPSYSSSQLSSIEIPSIQSDISMKNQKEINEKLESAFESLKESKFFKEGELIFSEQFGKQFQLKFSYYQNDDIVFSKIKEYKKIPKTELNSEEQPKQQSKQSQKQKRVSSKFHNFNKLFMYKLLATFTSKNFQELKVPSYLNQPLIKLIANIKLSTKQMKKYNKKSEFFSHDHYNLLFLHLNETTIGYLQNSPFSIYLNKLCFNFDFQPLETSSIKQFVKENQAQIQYINIIKRFCCRIVQNSNMLGKQQNSVNNVHSTRENMRQAYTQRALKGIFALNQGTLIKRF